MANASQILFHEDWSEFPLGPIHRDNTARGEYMAMVVPDNPQGWRHNASAGKAIDRDHSLFEVRQSGAGRVIELPAGAAPWGPSCILTPGPRPWRDYVATAQVVVKGPLPVGLVVRYQTNRDYCAAVFESGMFKLVRVLEGAMTVLAAERFGAGGGDAIRIEGATAEAGTRLASSPAKRGDPNADAGSEGLRRPGSNAEESGSSAAPQNRRREERTGAEVAQIPMRVVLRVEGTRLEARAGRVKLAANDACLEWGSVGLWANGPAAFGEVVVTAMASHVRRLLCAERQRQRRVNTKRIALPSMELLAEIDVRGHALGRQIRFADLDGDGREEFLFAVPTTHKGRRWAYNRIARISALGLDGRVLWERGQIQPDSADVTADLPFQAADRGAGVQVVAAFGPSLEALDPLTGKTLQRHVTPKPPKMEPYWDEINMYWGDGHFDDLPRLLPDSLRLCNFTGRHPCGDLFIKDRYHNGWALDGRTFEVLWHHRCNTGHYPFAADLNGDGRDEILLGYSRLDSRGNLIGRLYLGDHPDACFSYVDSRGVRHNLHPAGEAGLIDEASDGRVKVIELGHVQHLSLANFCPGRPGLERIVVTYHGNEGIIVLLDCDNRILRKAERYAAGAVCQPVNWTGDGRELIAFSPRLPDGGLWDEHFDLVVPFPGDRPGQCLEVRDVLGLGVDQLIVWDEERLHVYGPKGCAKRRPRAAARRYAPIRPDTNLSNYQVNFSLPRWAHVEPKGGAK